MGAYFQIRMLLRSVPATGGHRPPRPLERGSPARAFAPGHSGEKHPDGLAELREGVRGLVAIPGNS